eukprot:CAMPEP_0195107262 /NCGR_PEP_ID=MMETSP0448-20130528/81978_1 /TAXON_ID=66468 /ORGANISM="Heterocapsa triquestra, Strain CCMP 448" /LENGTH=122 /DNA_ID=CAMNT_0040143679 /DNA_START=80 /DNA_END=445 /DNA_ORIENTATION=+
MAPLRNSGAFDRADFDSAHDMILGRSSSRRGKRGGGVVGGLPTSSAGAGAGAGASAGGAEKARRRRSCSRRRARHDAMTKEELAEDGEAAREESCAEQDDAQPKKVRFEDERALQPGAEDAE